MILKQKVEITSSKVADSIVEFIDHLNIKRKKTRMNYESSLMDLYLYWGKDWNDWSLSESQGYLDYIIRVSRYKGFSDSNLNKKVRMMVRFFTYLNERNQIVADCLTPFHLYLSRLPKKKMKTRRTKKEETLPVIIQKFLLFLQEREYSTPSKYKKHLLPFQRFLESNGKNIDLFLGEDKESTLFEYIKKFESKISSRVSCEEITLATGTLYLRAVQLLVKFLVSENLISKKYTLPIHLRGRANRANEFVPKERMIDLMNAIYDNSNHVRRDLSIFLIILDTGCRPIEVSNLTINDVNLIERTLSFECRKTKKRRIKISLEVMEVIKDYLDIRDEYSPNTEYLFTTIFGNPISSSNINAIFHSANLKAFGESLYPAKAFRHTYITNALEEYSFKIVSRTIGHRDWKSTNYYYHRSKKRLLTNTLNKSPLMEMK
jgi:integrase/recombinase XerC